MTSRDSFAAALVALACPHGRPGPGSDRSLGTALQHLEGLRTGANSAVARAAQKLEQRIRALLIEEVQAAAAAC